MGAIQDSFRLDGKVAIVAGVGPTNGRQFALAMATAGADVCLVSRSRATPDAVAEEVRAMGRRAIVVPTDMTDSKKVDDMVAQARHELGRVDILFCHVGGVTAGGKAGLILETSDEEWRSHMLNNLDSAFYATRAAARVMVDQGTGGSIITTSSIAAVSTSPRMTAYGVAKAGLNQFTRSMAVELAPHNIRVNCIMLGGFANATERMRQQAPGFLDARLAEHPMHRFGEDHEAAGAALYFASDASTYTTGAILRITGGQELFG